MALAEQLGYRYEKPNAFHRLNQRMAATSAGAWVFSKLEHHLDSLVAQFTRGRTTFTEAMAGLPVLEVATTGARSGKRRTSPLLGIPTNGDLAIIGSGWGQAPTPGWVYNLRADPRATVAHAGIEVAAVAREPVGEELESIWQTARRLYPGYAKYPDRASHRDIAVFVLEAAPET